MKLPIYWLTTELENGNGTETNLFPSQEELEKAMAAHITARIEEVREGNEPAAEQALADEVEALLAAGDFDRAWELYKDGEAGDGSDCLCNPDDCFWWGQEEISTPLELEGNTLSDLERWAKRWGWDENQGNPFWRWVTLALVGAHTYELEREAEKAKSSQFTRWFYSLREETMHKWMREHAPEDVRQAYFGIVANGSAQFLPAESKHLEIRSAEGKVCERLLEAADKAIADAQQARAEAERYRKELVERMARLAVYEKLHDGLSDMIEGGRLREADIPDDYRWLADSLEEAASMEQRAGSIGKKGGAL